MDTRPGVEDSPTRQWCDFLHDPHVPLLEGKGRRAHLRLGHRVRNRIGRWGYQSTRRKPGDIRSLQSTERKLGNIRSLQNTGHKFGDMLTYEVLRLAPAALTRRPDADVIVTDPEPWAPCPASPKPWDELTKMHPTGVANR